MLTTVSLDLTIEDIELIKEALDAWEMTPIHTGFEIGVMLAAIGGGGEQKAKDIMDESDAKKAQRVSKAADLRTRLANL